VADPDHADLPAPRKSSCSAGAGRSPTVNRAAIHKVTLALLAPGPAPNLYLLPEGAPFASERVVAAVDFLVDAEGNNPERGHELASAATVAAQAVTRPPHPPTAPVATALTTRTKGTQP
jgi:hypothetical protein